MLGYAVMLTGMIVGCIMLRRFGTSVCLMCVSLGVLEM